MRPLTRSPNWRPPVNTAIARMAACLLYTSDAADERSSVDLGGRRIIKKKKKCERSWEMEEKTHVMDLTGVSASIAESSSQWTDSAGTV